MFAGFVVGGHFIMISAILFVLGASVGSFVNVIAVRYNPDKFLFGKHALLGRSRCPVCKSTLRWFELIPIVSYLLQGSRCRRCGAWLGLQYLLVELLTGLLFVYAPLELQARSLFGASGSALSAVWVTVFVALLLVSLIDMRLRIIPDEANILLVVLAAATVLLLPSGVPPGMQSFAGHYAFLFGMPGNEIMRRLIGCALGAVFFGVLFGATRGRGIGVGDIKLGAALGALFGWPDIFLVILLAFLFGSATGLALILLRQKTMKSFVPFGPFLALGAAATFFFGYDILRLYFGLLGA